MAELKAVIGVLFCLLPWPVKRLLLQWTFGWQLDRTARIRLSLFYKVQRLRLGPGAYIGHFNVFRNLRAVELGENAFIGQWNWITAASTYLDPAHGANPTLVVGDETAITSRHYLDCAGGVTIGRFTTVAGIRSTMLTHQIRSDISRQSVLPISIGDHCLLSSNTCVTPGARIPDRSLVAMGTVVVGDLQEPGMLYAGVPAKAIKPVGDGAYFSRKQGFVEV